MTITTAATTKRTYKFRPYLTKQQEMLRDNTIETCGRLYNDSLGERRVDWDAGFYEQKQLLTLRKQDNKYLKQVHSQVLQDAILRLDKAYQAFFKKLVKYPKFKKASTTHSRILNTTTPGKSETTTINSLCYHVLEQSS